MVGTAFRAFPLRRGAAEPKMRPTPGMHLEICVVQDAEWQTEREECKKWLCSGCSKPDPSAPIPKPYRLQVWVACGSMGWDC
jgi:hypothetical protein